MMAAEGGTVTFIYRGGGRDIVPRDATHIVMHESVTAIPARAFEAHPNIIEVYCHAGVKKIEEYAFLNCTRLRRVVMPDVEAVELSAFYNCVAIEYVECPKLERIGLWAFQNCTSLSSIDLTSAKVVGLCAFRFCSAMKYAKFGKNLETVGRRAFNYCSSLERITIPLKNDLFEDDDEEEDGDERFEGCANLTRVELLEAEVLDQTVAVLHLKEWRNDMTTEIDSINQILSNADAEEVDEEVIDEKTIAIQNWMSRVLHKITRYKAQHVQLLEEAAETLKNVTPSDIMVANVIPFLKLPTHTFDGENID